MLASLKSEFRKLLTVRSTYLFIFITLGIVALFAGFGDGFRANPDALKTASYLAGESTNAILFVGILLAIVGLLLLTNEYRYNTILYTSSSSNSRVKSLLAKLVTATVFAIVTSAIVVFFAPLCTIIGTHLAHKHMVAQTYHAWNVLLKCVFVGWGYAMYAFILGAIIRNQVGAIVTYLIIPLVGENILAAIFHSIHKYMPFSSLQSVISTGMENLGSNVSTTHNVVVACTYIAIGLLISFALFVKRDIN